nr:fused response regulator/phosphatase [Thiocystis violacea]
MVVDDDPVNLQLVKRMLELEGFSVCTAIDGEQAIRCFERERPDIVLMDIMMPVMNGIEATRRIKAAAAGDFVPVIFLTALSDEETMMGCIQAGGDDFLTKPFSFTLLKARILATERVRELQRRMAASSQPLADLLEREQQEQQLAERVFSRAINNRNVSSEHLSCLQTSAATFGGDLLLTQHLPDGGLRILMADITGHGLGATIGALPVADAFHAMTLKGVEDAEVLNEINRKLHGLLPSDRFMSACLITLSGSGRRLSWWNGGMPSAWLRTRAGLQELASHAVPLGVLSELPPGDLPRERRVEVGDSLLLFSDGLMAARDQGDQAFGAVRLDPHLTDWTHGEPIFPALAESLRQHCGETPQRDDIALLELRIAPVCIEVPEPESGQALGGDWAWSLELAPEDLARAGSLQSLLKPLGLLDGIESQREALERLFAALRAHALRDVDIKVLGQDPRQSDPGRVRLEIRSTPLPEGGRIWIRIMGHAGGGAVAAAEHPSARQETLRGLCESFSEDARRQVIEAVYRW